MRNIWAVTRETFLQCVRTRIIIVFGILLAVCVLGVGFKMTGDGTLKGRIQTFLAYSTSLTQLLLCLVTIFLTTSIITGDIRHKYIFTIASKPLARWQYVLGRWCGVVLLNVLLLSAAMGAIYVLAQHLRKKPTQMEQKAAAGLVREKRPDFDRLGVENEIFTARATYLPEPFKIDKLLRHRMKQLIEEKGLNNLLREHIRRKLQAAQSGRGVQAPLDETEVKKRLHDPDARKKAMTEIETELRNQELEKMQLVRPGQSLLFTFRGLTVPSRDCPPLQIRYKLHSFRSHGIILKSAWEMVNLTDNPETSYIQRTSRSDSAETTSSFMVDPRVVTGDGRLFVRYYNVPDPDPNVRTIVKITPKDITILQRVAGFEGNLVRAGLLILLRIMFLVAIAILFGVFLSFPITCLAVTMIFTISMMSGFLYDATRLPRHVKPSAFEYFSHYLVKGVFTAVPTFSRTSASDSLVDGEYIAPKTLIREYLVTFKQPGTDSSRFWQTIGLEFDTGMGLRTLLALAIGWLIFRRRELAGIN